MANLSYKQIPKTTFDELQLDAGVLLNNFTVTAPAIENENIITATTGGIQITATPTYSDLGSDVDNCPENTKELKHLDGWEISVSTTALGTSPELVAMALGAATTEEISSTEPNLKGKKITPNRDLEQTAFKDLWWVGGKANGGFVAAKFMNALSTGGFNLQTTKNGKGQFSLTITCHPSIETQDVVPVEFYSLDPNEE